MSVLPVLIDTRKSYKILISESDLSDYPCMFLKGNGTNGISSIFPKVPLAFGEDGDRSLKIEKEAEARGFDNIISLVTEENAASVLFHEKHGFTHAGRLEKVGVKFGKELDVLFLQKLLKGTL